MKAMIDIYEIGLAVLIEKLGVIQTERFIATIKSDDFDYTEWRRGYFAKFSDEEFLAAAKAYGEKHPYDGNAKIVI